MDGGVTDTATQKPLAGELDDTRRRGGVTDHGAAGMVAREQLDGRIGVRGGGDDAEAAAHVEDLVQLGVADLAALGDQLEDERNRQRLVDPVAHRSL